MDHEMTYEATWDQLSDFARQLVEAMGRDINDFDTDDWPDNVTQAVSTLAVALAADQAIVAAARTLDALMRQGHRHYGIASNEGATAALELHTAIEGGADYLAYIDRHADKRLADERELADELAAALPALMGAIHDGHDAGYIYVHDAFGLGRAALARHRAARASAPTP